MNGPAPSYTKSVILYRGLTTVAYNQRRQSRRLKCNMPVVVKAVYIHPSNDDIPNKLIIDASGLPVSLAEAYRFTLILPLETGSSRLGRHHLSS